ncbi:hypothetical protein ES708_10938 [subsurface metagenome]
MVRDSFVFAVAKAEADQLSKLVSDELDRRCLATDDIIQRALNVMSAMHTETAVADVKVAILQLVRASLADLERTLARVGLEPEADVKPEPKVEPHPDIGAKPELESGACPGAPAPTRHPLTARS